MARGRRANGEGHPRQRKDGRWEVQFLVTDPVTGERKRRSCYGRRRADALDAMHEVMDRAERGAPLKDASATVGAFVEQWLNTTLRVLPISENYRDQTRNLATNHLLVGPFSQRRLDQLRPAAIEGLLADLATRRVVTVAGEDVTRKPLSPSTIRSVFLIVRKVLDAAVRDGLLARNPAAQVSPPRVPRRAVTKLEGREVAQLLAELGDDRYFPVFALIAATGLRRGEALALRWKDVDLDSRVAYIHQTLSAARGGARLSPAKTSGSFRQVIFPEQVAEILKTWRRRQAAEQLAAGASWKDTGRVFTTTTGTMVEPRNILRTLKSAAERAGLPDSVGVHTLRHSAATAMLEAGVHVKAVSDSLGHSSSQITLDIYGYTADRVARAAADTLAATFGLTALPLKKTEGDDVSRKVIPLQ